MEVMETNRNFLFLFLNFIISHYRVPNPDFWIFLNAEAEIFLSWRESYFVFLPI